jgi:hypothetical protein
MPRSSRTCTRSRCGSSVRNRKRMSREQQNWRQTSPKRRHMAQQAQHLANGRVQSRILTVHSAPVSGQVPPPAPGTATSTNPLCRLARRDASGIKITSVTSHRSPALSAAARPAMLITYNLLNPKPLGAKLAMNGRRLSVRPITVLYIISGMRGNGGERGESIRMHMRCGFGQTRGTRESGPRIR